MERGESVVLAGQFGALIVTLLVLSSFISAQHGISSPLSTPTISNVYWGNPSTGMVVEKGGVLNQETTNASTMSVFYSLAPSTLPSSAAATRLCLTPNGTGETLTYNKISFLNDPKKGDYVSFGPTGQALGQICTYTVQFTDSLLQTVTWSADIKLVANSTVHTKS